VTIADEAFTGTDKYLNGLCIFRKGSFVGGFADLKGGREGIAEATKLAENIKMGMLPIRENSGASPF